MRSWIAAGSLRAFAKRYRYDVSYLEMMLNESPAAFFKFAPIMKASGHREWSRHKPEFPPKIFGPSPRIGAPHPNSPSPWRSKGVSQKTKSGGFSLTPPSKNEKDK